MNRKLVQTVRDFIATLPRKRFDMSWWAQKLSNGEPVRPQEVIHNRGTSACIGGWAVALLTKRDTGEDTLYRAGRLLGLSAGEADALFAPDSDVVDDYEAVTNTQAVRVLDHLLTTGVVDWAAAFRRKARVQA